MPYQDLNGRPSIVVDGAPAVGTVLTLSHWPGAPAPDWARRDTSTEMAFAYLDRAGAHLAGVRAVSNNHLDQDGLAGVFALVHPDVALARRAALVDLARAGDFGVFSSRSAARASMAVDHWPNGSYQELLPRVVELIDHVDRFRHLWGDEDAQLQAGLNALANEEVVIDERPDLDLAVVTGPRVHSMAITTATPMARLLFVDGRSYEYADRYETWVQYVSRRPLARRDQRVLADELNALEPGSTGWTGGDPGSIMPSLTGPTESAIEPAVFVATIERFLTSAPPAWDPYA